MATTITLTGRLADLTSQPIDPTTTTVTIKAPAFAPGPGVELTTTQPATAPVGADGEITISTVEGVGWLTIDGPGWSDSIRFVAAAGMTTVWEAVVNALPHVVEIKRLLVALHEAYMASEAGQALPTWLTEAALSSTYATKAEFLLALRDRVNPLVLDILAADSTVVDAAAAAVQPLAQGAVDAAADAIKWRRGNLAAGASVDTLIGASAVGIHPVGASAPGLPVAGSGWVTVTHDPFSGSTTQTFRAASPAIKGSWSRQYWGGTWRAWAPLEWVGLELSSGTDLNTVTTPGTYGIATTGLTNTPAGAGIGTLEVLPFGNAVIQRYTDRGTRMWTRYVGASQTEWAEHPTVDQVENMLTGSTPGITVSEGSSSGMKVVPLSVTLPGTTVRQQQSSGSVRWVRRWSHMPSRVRLHIANRNPANAANSGSAVIYCRAGSATEDGTMVDHSLVIPGTTLPEGEEIITDWFDPRARDGEFFGVTIGYANASEQQVLQGGGWVKDTNTGWYDATTDGWTWSQTTPFYVWVEAEVPASAPVLIVSGDSVSIGTATDDPVSDSWPAFYGLDQNALPVYFCQHGSTLTNWEPTSARWANMFPGMTVRGDALVVRLGSNDIVSTSVDLEELKTRYAAVREAHSQQFPGVPVYIGGMTPSTRPPEREIVRREFDDWLKTLPYGERDWFDFRSALAAPDDETLIPEYSADGTHPSTAGQRRMADVVLERPVTPYVATQSQLRNLAAL